MNIIFYSTLYTTIKPMCISALVILVDVIGIFVIKLLRHVSVWYDFWVRVVLLLNSSFHCPCKRQILLYLRSALRPVSAFAWDYCIELADTKLLYVRVTFANRMICRGLSSFVTGCPWYAWYRVLTTRQEFAVPRLLVQYSSYTYGAD